MNIFDQIGSAFAFDFISGPTVNPQYQPQQRTWVRLTWSDVPDDKVSNKDFMDGAKWADKQLKEKNT